VIDNIILSKNIVLGVAEALEGLKKGLRRGGKDGIFKMMGSLMPHLHPCYQLIRI